MNIDLTYDQIDVIIVQELRNSLNYNLEPDNDPYESLDVRLDLIVSLLDVLEHYTNKTEFNKILFEALNKVEVLIEFYEGKLYGKHTSI